MILRAKITVTIEFDKPTKDIPNNKAIITQQAEFIANGVSSEEICRCTATLAVVKMLRQINDIKL